MKRKQDNKQQHTQSELLMEFYRNHPNKNIAHPEIVDWATNEWQRRTGTVFRDPDRGIRKLYEAGYLIKIKKGVYRYDPKTATQKTLEDFTAKQKAKILKRDNYKCVVCGHGKKEGVELHIDHIKPKELGGKATIRNGQTLCSRHNIFKKKLRQTETGKKMFIRLYELAKQENDIPLQNFCINILKVYESHNINGHITWKE